MKAKLLISSFREGENQGLSFFWGAKTLEVHTEFIPLIVRNGDINGEIHRNEKVTWVTLADRQFQVSKFYDDDGTFAVLVPYEVAKKTFETMEIW